MVASGYQMLTKGTIGAIITIILIVLVVKFALSQPYNFEGALSYWFILIVGIALALYIGGLFS